MTFGVNTPEYIVSAYGSEELFSHRCCSYLNLSVHFWFLSNFDWWKTTDFLPWILMSVLLWCGCRHHVVHGLGLTGVLNLSTFLVILSNFDLKNSDFLPWILMSVLLWCGCRHHVVHPVVVTGVFNLSTFLVILSNFDLKNSDFLPWILMSVLLWCGCRHHVVHTVVVTGVFNLSTFFGYPIKFW